jgi:hypothetical protein
VEETTLKNYGIKKENVIGGPDGLLRPV